MRSRVSMLWATVFAGGMLLAGTAARSDDSLAQSRNRLLAAAIGSAALAVPMTDTEMDAKRGAGFFGSLLTVLAPQNTVQAQLGDSAPVVNSGPGPQTLTLSTPTTNANLSASNSIPPPPNPVVTTQTIVATRGFAKSFSFHF